MLVTLMSQEKLITIKLPNECNGKYWIEDKENNNKLLSIEANENKNRWIIKSTITITLYNFNQDEVNELTLRANDINYIRFGANSINSGFLFVQEDDLTNNTFEKYKLIKSDKILIGRNTNCDIIIDNFYVSGVHAILTFQNNVWRLEESKEANGIYADEIRFYGSDVLSFGTCIYIFGVKIILQNGFIVINNPNHIVTLSELVFEKMIFDNFVDKEEAIIKEELYYYRSPRFIRNITSLQLKVDMPPQAEKVEDTPILLTLAPSMIMGVASFSTGIFTLVNALNNDRNIMSTIPTLIMSISMLAGMIVFPFVMKKREVKNKEKKEKLRRVKYLKYLTEIKQEVEHNKRYQMDILNENNPMILDKTRQADFWKAGLWSKNQDDSDYLFIRLGLGNLPMQQQIVFPEDRFMLDDDEMRTALFQFQAEEKLLFNVPVGLELIKNKCVGISGNNKNIINVICLITMQVALLHGYDEVKIGFIGEKKDFNKLQYIKNINHIWNNDKEIRYLAVTEEETRQLSVEFNKVLIKRKEVESSFNPYIILIIASRNLARQASFLNKIDWTKDDKIRVIYCYDDNGELPRECDTIVKLDVNSGLIYGKSIDNYSGIKYVQDLVKREECDKVIQKSLKQKLNIKEDINNLPKSYSFMQMFEVGKVQHLNITHRWKENNPTQSLRTEIGVGSSGDKFYLDLHEKSHGPHGLIAGMTGSGKSEFIISYILSMAINYHPDEVAFVLIDYKGGGLAGAFDNDNYKLPHLAGTITNLDSGAIYRSILSINSELKYRQTVFNEVKTKFGEGTMDIYKYQKMYRANLVKEPMPHLFIISDEFAELKDQQPEFMDELISTARIGRSLGVHLILATQKPSGVVSPQIWSNSKFKVCLKVQDKSDSMEMLKRPEAAELSDIGRFYLQVGYNELFLMGQSAWSGAKYPDMDEYHNEGEKDIEIIDNQGTVIERIKFNKESEVDNGEQIVQIMKYLDTLAEELHISERQLWLPEIPENIYLDELIAKYGVPDTKQLVAIAGELDDPYTQSQRLLIVDFEIKGNVIVYGNSGSGVNLFVESVLFSMFEMYSPIEFNTYILDFENESLKQFKDILHVGEVITDGEDEKIDNLYLMLKNQIKERRKLLSELGIDINEYNNKVEKKLAKILVVISNYSHFIENYEKFEDINITLARDGMKYGIYFMITANSASAIRYRVSQNFNQHYVLKLNDVVDYTAILGSVGGRSPEKYVGRGMIKDKEIYMFQAAHITYDNENSKQYIHKFSEALNRKYNGKRAPKIFVMPEFITLDEFKTDNISFSNIPFGIEYKSYKHISLNLIKNPLLGITANKNVNISNFVLELVKEISSVENVKIKVFNAESLINIKTIRNIEIYDNWNAGFEELHAMCLSRNNEYKNNNGNVSIDMNPVVVVFNSYTDIKSKLSIENQNNINALLNAVAAFWNVYFIIIDKIKILSDNSIQKWCAEEIKNNIIWIGNEVSNIKLYLNIKGNNISDIVAAYSGYYFKNGHGHYVKLMMEVQEEENE